MACVPYDAFFGKTSFLSQHIVALTDVANAKPISYTTICDGGLCFAFVGRHDSRLVTGKYLSYVSIIYVWHLMLAMFDGGP